MQIRKAGIENIKAIVDIWERFLNEHDGIVLAQNPELKDMLLRNNNAPSKYEEFLINNIQSGNGVVFIAEENGCIAGYSLGLIKDEIPIFRVKRYGYISDMYVQKQYRGKGVSSTLKDEMISWFKSKGMRYVSVGYYADNHEAHKIYEKWGFFDYKIEARMKI